MQPATFRAQVEALVQAEWRSVKASSRKATASPRDSVSWSYRITPPLPASWPPGGKGQVCYYAFAGGLRPALADAEVVAAPWARVVMDATGRQNPGLEILTPQLQELGIQGVRPLTKEEISIWDSRDAVEQEIYGLSRSVTRPDGAGRLKEFYCLFLKTHGAVGKAVRSRHREFFDWLGCE